MHLIFVSQSDPTLIRLEDIAELLERQAVPLDIARWCAFQLSLPLLHRITGEFNNNKFNIVTGAQRGPLPRCLIQS